MCVKDNGGSPLHAPAESYREKVVQHRRWQVLRVAKQSRRQADGHVATNLGHISKQLEKWQMGLFQESLILVARQRL